MKTIRNDETKGMVFAGCSFTWGQGLYYYSNLPTLREPGMYRYNGEIVTDAHKRYMQSVRFPRLVANHFKTFELVSYHNGGRETDSFMFLKKVFNLIPESQFLHLFNEKFHFNEIEYIVLQTSQINRNSYYYEFEGTTYEYRIHDDSSHSKFYEYLSKNNITFEDALKDLANKLFVEIKDNLKFYENCGIKTLLLHWENDYSQQSESDEWIKERLVTFDYNGKNYKSINDLMMADRNLEISEDYRSFIVPPKDGHPSLECNKIIADAIINKIENKKHK
jgi:hypothetical protein